MKIFLCLFALLLAACGSDIRPVTQDHDTFVADIEGIPTDNIIQEDVDSPDPDTLGDEIVIDEDTLIEESVVPDEDEVLSDTHVEGNPTDSIIPTDEDNAEPDSLGDEIVVDEDSAFNDGADNDIVVTPPTRIWNYSTGLENDVLVSAVTDSEGNVYVAGNQAVEGMTFHKFTPEGTRTDWFFKPGDNSRVYAATISGNSIIAVGNIIGTFEGSTGPGYDDFFVVWFTLDGTRIKTKRWGTAVNNHLYDIAVDLDGSIIVIGDTQTSVNPGEYKYDAYAAKISPSGELLWETQWQPQVDSVYARGVAISIGPNGNAFVSGIVGRTSAADAFITLLDSDGNVVSNNIYDSGYEDVVTDNLYTYDILTLGWSQYPQEEGSAQGFLTDHEFPNDIGRDIPVSVVSKGEELLVVGSNYLQNAVLWNIGNWTVPLSDTGGSVGSAIAVFEDNIYVGWSDGALSYVSRWR